MTPMATSVLAGAELPCDDVAAAVPKADVAALEAAAMSLGLAELT